MKCPNCGNTEDIEMVNTGIKIFKKESNIKKKAICLKCGFKFSKEIEVKYGG